jgi:hypothetical protein
MQRIATTIDETKYEKIEQGLGFLLKHFGTKPWPRKLSTPATKLGQYAAYSTTEAMTYFRGAFGVDVRINIFGVEQRNPDCLLIDLDTTTTEEDDEILADTLWTIDHRIGGTPSVYHTGRGYHIVQPIKCAVDLDIAIPELKELVGPADNVSNKFLQFAERYLSNGKSDPSHNPALKSCLTRIPFSINSKNNAQVTVIQEWDGYRPYYMQLYDIFYEELKARKKKQREQQQQIIKSRNNSFYPTGTFQIPQQYQYIEDRLLKTPIDDDRKLVVGIILSRYLINVKRLEYEKAYEIIWQWLDSCAKIKRLEPSRSYFDQEVVRYQLDLAQKNGIPAMTETKLQEKYPGLYSKLWTSGELI